MFSFLVNSRIDGTGTTKVAPPLAALELHFPAFYIFGTAPPPEMELAFLLYPLSLFGRLLLLSSGMRAEAFL